jgi:GNAT superfamily N-acetyltransferase
VDAWFVLPLMALHPSGLRLDKAFEQEVTLDDRRRVRLRWLRPSDAGLLRDGFARLSMASRLSRFFAPLHVLSDESLRHLTGVDGINHAALVAVSDQGVDPPERSVGIARFVRLPDDPESAEVTVTVTDEAQGHGLGRSLVEILAVAARERGVETFSMKVLWSSGRVHRILRHLGAVRRRMDGEVVEYSIATSSLARRALAARIPYRLEQSP